jgi:phosphate transport system protein
MQRLLDKGLEELTVMVFKMGKLAEQALSKSVSGYLEGRDVTKDVGELSEVLFNRSVEVEEKSFSLITKYQPVASDLRIINSYVKIAYDFYRYGRYAWDIAFISSRFNGKTKQCDKWVNDYVAKMAQRVMEMVTVSINSVKTLDPELVKNLSTAEDEVDNDYLMYLTKLVEAQAVTNECTISSLLVVRYLERVADHAMHIMEAVVYIATGEKLNLS